MRATLSLVAILIFAVPVLGSSPTHDPKLESRAREYFGSLVAGDFARLWNMSSVSVRADMGYDRDDFVERMTQMAAYDLKFVLVACCSHESEGWVFLEIQIRQNKADDWDVRNYEARWVREGDEWFLESLVDVTSFEWALTFCDRIPASPN